MVDHLSKVQRRGGNSIQSQGLCNLIPSHNITFCQLLKFVFIYFSFVLFFQSKHSISYPLFWEAWSSGMFCMGISCMMLLLSQIPYILALRILNTVMHLEGLCEQQKCNCLFFFNTHMHMFTNISVLFIIMYKRNCRYWCKPKRTDLIQLP